MICETQWVEQAGLVQIQGFLVPGKQNPAKGGVFSADGGEVFKKRTPPPLGWPAGKQPWIRCALLFLIESTSRDRLGKMQRARFVQAERTVLLAEIERGVVHPPLICSLSARLVCLWKASYDLLIQGVFLRRSVPRIVPEAMTIQLARGVLQRQAVAMVVQAVASMRVQ